MSTLTNIEGSRTSSRINSCSLKIFSRPPLHDSDCAFDKGHLVVREISLGQERWRR